MNTDASKHKFRHCAKRRGRVGEGGGVNTGASKYKMSTLCWGGGGGGERQRQTERQ